MKNVATFRCKDLGLSCDYEVEAKDENEMMKRIEGHMKTVHRMDVNKAGDREQLFRILQYR